MELAAIQSVEWLDDKPTEEGLYLFMSTELTICKHDVVPDYYTNHHIDVVHIKQRIVTNQSSHIVVRFECDCDSWPTWYDLNCIPFSGRWSKKIKF